MKREGWVFRAGYPVSLEQRTAALAVTGRLPNRAGWAICRIGQTPPDSSPHAAMSPAEELALGRVLFLRGLRASLRRSIDFLLGGNGNGKGGNGRR